MWSLGLQHDELGAYELAVPTNAFVQSWKLSFGGQLTTRQVRRRSALCNSQIGRFVDFCGGFQYIVVGIGLTTTIIV